MSKTRPVGAVFSVTNCVLRPVSLLPCFPFVRGCFAVHGALRPAPWCAWRRASRYTLSWLTSARATLASSVAAAQKAPPRHTCPLAAGRRPRGRCRPRSGRDACLRARRMPCQTRCQRVERNPVRGALRLRVRQASGAWRASLSAVAVWPGPFDMRGLSCASRASPLSHGARRCSSCYAAG
jgi:hypothetical protein